MHRDHLPISQGLRNSLCPSQALASKSWVLFLLCLASILNVSDRFFETTPVKPDSSVSINTYRRYLLNIRPALLAGLTGAITSDNKIYLLRRCGAVAPRVLGPTRQKIADKAQAGRLFCALPRGASGTIGDAKVAFQTELMTLASPIVR